MTSEVTFVTSSDDSFILGLEAILLSFLTSQEKGKTHPILVVDGGLSDDNKAYIIDLLERFSKNRGLSYTLDFYTPSLDRWKKFPPHWGSYAVYGYLEAFHEVRTPYFLLVDSDVIHFKNVSEILSDFKASGQALAGVRDSLFKTLENDGYSSHFSPDADPQSIYINTGFLLVNLERFNPNAFYDFVGNVDAAYTHQKIKGKKGFLFDQSLLNGYLSGNVYELEESWNFLALGNQKISQQTKRANFHFVSQPKPWVKGDASTLARTIVYSIAAEEFLNKARSEGDRFPRKDILLLKWKLAFYKLIRKTKKIKKLEETFMTNQDIKSLESRIANWCRTHG